MPTYYSVNGEGDLNNVYLHNYEEYLVTDTFVTSGRLWGWGLNTTNGNLGDNTTTSKSSPVQTVSGGTNWKTVSAAGSTSAGIKTDGTLWLWGLGTSGQLGNNAITSRSSPVQTVSGGTNWKQVMGGGTYTAATKTDGTLWLWGSNAAGQLGDNSVTNKSSPVQTVSGGNNWRQVSCGNQYTAAIKNDGTLWLWGYNNNGQLGDNTSGVSKSSPVQTVSGGTNWKQVSCGSSHTAAIKTDGTLWLWGSGGRLGDNTTTNRSSPVQTVSGGTNWKQVSCGVAHTAAIKTDGTLWLWGDNSDGQLGDNSITSRSSPVQTIATGTNWREVAAAATGTTGTTAAIKTDNSLWLWGRGTNGQLGNNAITSRSSPVQTIAGGTVWRDVSIGDTYTAAVTY